MLLRVGSGCRNVDSGTFSLPPVKLEKKKIRIMFLKKITKHDWVNLAKLSNPVVLIVLIVKMFSVAIFSCFSFFFLF